MSAKRLLIMGRKSKFNLLAFSTVKRHGKAETLNKSGVYAIVNKLNGHKYIGQSKDIYGRWISHKRELNRDLHINAYLQNAWNHYRRGAFEFVVLEYCETDCLNDKEQYWLERLLP